ncbi:peptidoglycan-binding domain-containing protein [Kribbella sancticallisti]|uniref:peptidoglycan-binding domain-containing protein n=1 Tax=Kribbella sancticallisti TaxID=460087 RepID=UPI0031D543F5
MARRTLLTAVAVLAVGGALTAALLTRSDSSQAADETPAALTNTAKVTRQTLKDTETADGELAYGTTTTATNRAAGTVTWLPDSGQQISRGQTLYQVNNLPTTLLYGAVPAYRRLAEDSEGPDVLQLEQNLKALGYTGLTVDDEYTSATAEAVEEWQEDRGLEETGVVELGQVVFAPAAVRVDSLQAQVSDPVAPGQKLLGYTGTTKAVTVELEAADQRLAKENAAVSVTLPDNTTVAGKVDEVSTVIIPAASPDQDPETKIEVIVALGNQKAAASYALASVDVTFTATERKNVLTVPVGALLALQEGGFGVEIADGTTTRYVPVKTGLFAGGRVEISGAGITEGLSVGVPK